MLNLETIFHELHLRFMANGIVNVKEKCMAAGRVALPQSGKSCLLTEMAISDSDSQDKRIRVRLREIAESWVETGSPDGICLASTAERWPGRGLVLMKKEKDQGAAMKTRLFWTPCRCYAIGPFEVIRSFR